MTTFAIPSAGCRSPSQRPHCSPASLPACVPLVVGGAAVGAGLVATDRRSSGAQLDDQGIELRGAARIREIANDQMYVSVTSFNRQVLLTGKRGQRGRPPARGAGDPGCRQRALGGQ